MQFLRRIFLFSFITLSSYPASSQNQDIIVTLKESVLNNMFSALGEIKGISAYSFMFIEGTYDWTLIRPQIQLHPNRADFITDVKVAVGKHNYFIHVNGKAEVCYEPTTNLIYVEITEAAFPLNILFFGKVKHLWDVDLVQYFETPFTFEGPLTVGTEMIFDMPDHSKKILYAHPLNCGVKIAEKQIIVSAELEFISRAIATPISK